MDNREFTQYLATGEFNKVEAEASAEDAAIAVVATVKKVDPFLEILVNLCAVGMLAKDFHYRCKGKAFYGEHLLADLFYEVENESDDINEIRYMGELQANPPLRAEIARMAVEVIDWLPMKADENGLVEALYDRMNALVGLVEQAKALNPAPASGTTAVLDTISQKALQAAGFLRRVMAGDDMTEKVDADAESTSLIDE